jgi:four helix bundle protein
MCGEEIKMTDYPITERSFDFAVKVVELYKKLISDKKEFILSRQMLRAGTSIGANVAEAQRGQSKPDFISKINIALKEAIETVYWLRLLSRTGYISGAQFKELKSDIEGIVSILTAIGRTASANMKNKK